MLFHLEFTVGYGAEMSQQDLFRIWADEARAALESSFVGREFALPALAIEPALEKLRTDGSCDDYLQRMRLCAS